uniref:Glycoside hydrolase family 5 domain-containing protein n=1 Tax=Entomoneis paludosa TaxID=265537 RepID=A0A7S2YSP1_9STRA|eukprot:CAMPEP_0172454964 /NCGR_PEP_ID=MMETSP1065-20121228/11795_1 /TAXON_ID=265537 /ORGANISM="Amphiprora paludosa, Strain CCMP125" /LENGTH=681 /DNA_ID=CAMNT_0013207387 /DNA_START=148 /DNA_END=2193 /DNA_ORIENTATION=+
MTCSADEHARPFNNQIRGVNLGGWMVLEPWITPSLFYQFLSGRENSTAFDTYTFCQVLGATEANRQLRNHWDKWVTEDIIAELANSGAVNSLRLPVGDYMYKPYGPYVGCFDGALQYVDNLLDWAYSHGLTVLFDIHTMKDSQNGFDNSGQALGFQWTSALSAEYVDQISFQHWPIRDAKWMGTFDQDKAEYSYINRENIKHSLAVIQEIVDRYAGHPAVLGLEPVNEPWQYTPIDELKRFYWEGYLMVKRQAPFWKYIMHDSFRLDPNLWGGFMDGCPERALDTHIYQAWRDPDSRIGFYTNACNEKGILATMEREFGPVIVGEWSLATDNCAMWLNGFNDNLPGFPRLPCKYTPCADSYLGKVQPGVPLDPAKPLQGPYGTGISGPIYGLCPSSRDWVKESSGNPLTGRDWVKAPPQAPQHLDDTDNVMRNLALKKLDAFAGIAHGFYFWNFRTDLYDPQWSYMAALDRGWIPRGSLMSNNDIDLACKREDENDYICVFKKHQLDSAVRDAVHYALEAQNLTSATHTKVFNLTGSAFLQAADDVISDYFEKFHKKGATCDFGGTTQLVERGRNITDEEWVYYSDDEYRFESNGPQIPIWMFALIGLGVALFGAFLGFIVAMRCSPGFNARIRSYAVLNPITKSHSSMIRSSLNLPALSDYDEIKQVIATNQAEQDGNMF